MARVSDTPVYLPTDPPNPPRNVKVKDITQTSCTLTWDAPEFDGGSPVTGYYIEKFTGSRWAKVNKKPIKDRKYDFDDLMEGSEYDFRVCAENDAGISKPSDGCGKFIAKDPFDAPSKMDAPKVNKITKDAADLSWEPPASDGGAPIEAYIVEKRKVGDVKWSPAGKVKDTSTTVDGLEEGTEYEFRITPVNKAGPGQPSPGTRAKYGK